MKRFLQLHRTFLIYMGAGMALSFLGALFSNCSLVNSFDPKDFAIDGISFNKTAASLGYGSMDMLSLKIDPVSAQVDAAVAWQFDETVISGRADNFGLVMTGIKAGETIVRATAYGKTATCLFTVLPGSGEPNVLFPYVYSNTDFIEVRPGDTAKAAASLHGGTASDINGFTFTIDKPAVASLTTEGNYAWITGQNEGIAKVTVRHSKAAYGFSFLVSCQTDSHTVPYITTPDNIVTINRSLQSEASFMADLKNPPSASYEGLFDWSLVDVADLSSVWCS